MTPPDPQQVAEIAGRLSKAQREALIHCQGSVAVCRRLREKGLATTVAGTGMAWDAYPTLSPLGAAVRNFIQGNDHD